MSKIIKVIPKEDHTLVIQLENLHVIIYNMKPRLRSVRFCELADIEKFKDLRIENGNTLVWDNLCQLTIDEIFCTLER